jgi:hypothetical protein
MTSICPAIGLNGDRRYARTVHGRIGSFVPRIE